MVKYICKLCNYSTKRKANYERHLKTKKHTNFNKTFNCQCGKVYKFQSGFCKHKNRCEYHKISDNLKKLEKNNMENKNEIIELKKTNTLIMKELIKSNSNNGSLMNEVKKIKEKNSQIVKQNITNNNVQNNIQNIQNVSINVFLNEHCQNAMSLVDFVEQLQITIEDLVYTGQTNYVEGISSILIKNLNKMDKLERPIHCSDVKRKILYIKNEEGWEKDGKHEKIKKCIKDVELKQIQKIPEWTKEENIDIYKSDNEGMKYQKVVFNSMGGMDSGKREKNKSNVIKKISEGTNYKEII